MSTRRDFIKASIAAATAAVVGIRPSRAEGQGATGQGDAGGDVQWDATPCRFCGTGCGLLVGTRKGRVVAVKGDPDAPVNRGLLCIKGYANARILYGEDRLTHPLLRMKGGKFDKEGDFTPVTWAQAFDEMERQFRRVHGELGPSGLAVMGSGQYTILEGYAASKLVKAGWRSNNLEPNARHCMASSVAAFMQTFGIDEPAGCYDDIELTDTVVAFGANMAEAHPMLWSRVVDRHQRDRAFRVFNLTTFGTPTSDLADTEIIFRPNTDLAIWNYLAREIIARNRVDAAFVKRHCVFATGPRDIGFGMRRDDRQALPSELDTRARERKVTLSPEEAIAQGETAGAAVEQRSAGEPDKHWLVSFAEFKKALEPYTLEFVARLSQGDPDEPPKQYREKLKLLADHYAEPARKVVTFWTMGFNQHTRGTWVNEQAYMVHLLTGKQAKPGSGAFSLTGQPSACGTAREVGTFTHRLPADMVVTNPKHRARAEKIWKLPARTINPKVGSHITQMMRDLEDGKIQFLWVQVTNPFQSTANANRWIKAARDKGAFLVVSDPYPGISTKVADLILPSAMIFEKWGGYGNSERRTQLWREQVAPPGEARSDLWQMLEFSKRLKVKDCWGEQKLPGLTADGYEPGKLPSVLADAATMGISPEATLYEVLFATSDNVRVKWPDPVAKGHANHTASGIDWFPEKALFEEYAQFGRGHAHDLAPFDRYFEPGVRGLRWPVVDGKETPWRFNEKYDRYVTKGTGIEFYGEAMKELPSGTLGGVSDPKLVSLHGKAKIFFRPYQAPPESPDERYDLWLSTGRVLEHWHSGTMTCRVPELYRAMPGALLYMNPGDAEKRGLARNDVAWIESRRGKIKVVVETGGRYRMPSGSVYVPWFDEGVFINKLTLDATCPISKQIDFKKCAVRVFKA